MLTEENYSKGFLIDEELMGGVTKDPETQGRFVAFVLRHTTGEYLGYEAFENLQEALKSINGVQRRWEFEQTGGCGGGNCGKTGEACNPGSSCNPDGCAFRTH